MSRTLLAALTLSPLLLACESSTGGSISPNDDNVSALATATQGPYVDAVTLSLVAAFGDESACPSVVSNDTTALIQGGCTDEQGQVWMGEARVADTFIELVDFGVEGVNIANGSIAVEDYGYVADYRVDGIHSVVYSGYTIEVFDASPGAFYGGVEAGGLPMLDLSGAFFPCEDGLSLSMDVAGGDQGNLAVELDQCRGTNSWTYGDQSGTMQL